MAQFIDWNNMDIYDLLYRFDYSHMEPWEIFQFVWPYFTAREDRVPLYERKPSSSFLSYKGNFAIKNVYVHIVNAT